MMLRPLKAATSTSTPRAPSPPSRRPRTLAPEAETLAGLHDAASVEGRNLYKHVGSLVVHFGGLRAHDAGDDKATLLVGDNHHLFIELSDLTVEHCHPLAGVGAANDDAVPHLTSVEGVDRLSRFDHDVVS